MREYELSMIFDLALAESGGPDASVEAMKRVVEGRGGVVKSVDHWGRRRMAYPINKALDGDYVISRIEIDPAEIRAIESAFRIDERVYRTLVIRSDELYEITPMPERPERRSEAPPRPQEPAPPPAPAPAQPAATTEAAAPETVAEEPAAETPAPETAAEEPAEAPAAEATPAEAEEKPADEPAAQAEAVAEEPAAEESAGEDGEDEEKAEE